MVITKNDIEILLPNVQVIGDELIGGQKTVYKVLINGKTNALKFIIHDESNDDTDEIRCNREVDTLNVCNSPNLIKLGEIPLTFMEYNNHKLMFYSEEWIEGCTLQEHIKANGGILLEEEVIRLGIDISFAIEELWKYNRVHRDIKPTNIMFDNKNKRFVLLDMGMVFDSSFDTLTKFGFLPGTMGYYSPEQFDFAKKKDIDFRSDLFCLGIVIYVAITGYHPFWKKGLSNDQIFYNIIHSPFTPINELNHVSNDFANVIHRLLKKRPSERFM